MDKAIRKVQFIGYQETRDGNDFPYYNVFYQGEKYPATYSGNGMKRRGIKTPSTPSLEEYKRLSYKPF